MKNVQHTFPQGTTRLITMMLLVCVMGCKKIKKPDACISGPETVEVGQSATYTWCGDKADKIKWNSSGGSGNGSTFTVEFKNAGVHTIYVEASNKYSRDSNKSISVNCIRKSYVWCSIDNYCLTGGSTIYNGPDVTNYKAYLYISKSDWIMDADNGTHASCIDSVSCAYSPEKQKVGAHFKKEFITGSVVFVCIEYRNPQSPDNLLSNWSELLSSGASGSAVNINNSTWSDNSGYAGLYSAPRKILSGKWRLIAATINGTSVTLAACNQDDYIKFSTNGTWKYYVGTDNCNGSSQESIGSYGTLPACISGSDIGLSMNCTSGPLAGTSSGYFSESCTKLKVNFSSGSTSGVFEFTRAQ